jgi:signal transduction histidine kinase
VVVAIVAAALFLGTTLAILRLAINDDRLAITTLQDRLADASVDAEADRERLHEVKGTIAGIASASRLIHHDPPLPGPSRDMLEEMLERESARLQRLMEGHTAEAPREVLTDDVLRPLIVARRAQGQFVAWRCSGLAAWARADDVTEVLNILLDNTARHAAGAPVAVFAREADQHVEVVVADSGPGVPAALRTSLFHRGASGTESTGEGLGLHLARRLMARNGGYVRWDPTWRQGAAFVVGVRQVSVLTEGARDDVASIAQ